MNFPQAVGAAFRRYAEFSGRSCRSEYWYFVLFLVIAHASLEILDKAVSRYESWSPLSSIFAVAVLVPSIAIGVRRLHDVDRSGWWLLLLVVPFIGWIVLLVWACRKGDVGENRFGPDPLPVSTRSEAVPTV